MKKVVLIGYMGSGKSVIASQLAHKLNRTFVELDACIEKKCNLSVAAIFEKHGELYFRKLERTLFLELLQDTSNDFIISTGGGTPCYYNNHELLQGEGVVSIYLKASIATLTNRLEKDQAKRPLLANISSNDLSEFIAKHLFDRNYYYNQATYTVSVDHKSVEEITNEIADLLV
jgi:shikimate kinase